MTDVLIDGIRYVPEPAPQTDKTLLAALNVRFNADFAADTRIRDYFSALLKLVIEKGDEFNGKRPFGFSSWRSDLYDAVESNGFVENRAQAKLYLLKMVDAAINGIAE